MRKNTIRVNLGHLFRQLLNNSVGDAYKDFRPVRLPRKVHIISITDLDSLLVDIPRGGIERISEGNYLSGDIHADKVDNVVYLYLGKSKICRLGVAVIIGSVDARNLGKVKVGPINTTAKSIVGLQFDVLLERPSTN